MAYNFEAGEVLLIDKPLTWTSFDVVKKVRNTLRIKKIGHAGTLDPLASGLLILCTGKFTKSIDQIQAQEKEYTGTIILGQYTPSYDKETEVTETKDISHLTPETIKAAAESFVGTIEQVPPIYSAVMVDGKRAYDLARRGKAAELKPRTITIKAFDITNIEGEVVSFRVVCTKGTYIRSLAHDLGVKLEVGGHLGSLVRTRIGDYKLEDALTIEAIQAIRKAQLEADGSNT
ncbi:tRNA pseudouridine(55) synthase TruB [Pontibacter sp. BT310]|uniref:tRNA pseudouridine synthase B n=1 Tax=Pontibacter populi TaxID=890055 RepID=A0ABS6XDR3_9BACT|nr:MULTISPECIES: tRNA pseudouridine(55) synthase TruB [Pontibacter]MBJ6118417.1 tRNA pseudouridine(55) synthase TruB [Pontibacter sp. BT310]MBR0570845.1 tRNA pseudouridine(55) synthase TruB [Microvirga sp. STS03]MBW3365271.1 tRNA pseudouridine(55) synthase TruB [Pontibacter populi]